jgi:thymidylate synthase
MEKIYLDLLRDVLKNGMTKNDRTGTGTLSVFGRQIVHNMSDGFPLLTTKKMYWKGIVAELIWFLRGDTNIKFLVDNDVHIWDGDAYKNYLNRNMFEHSKTLGFRPYTKEEFINKIKTDAEFAEKWGDLGPIYGKQWRSWGGFDKVPSGWNHGAVSEFKDIAKNDQILNLVREIKLNPDSRRLMVNAWNVDELNQMSLPPCHYGFQIYTRELNREERIRIYNSQFENKIEVPFIKISLGDGIENTIDNILNQVDIPTRAISLMWNQRSVDLFLGLPFNIASYGLLLTILGKALNMAPDKLIGSLGDTHLYLNHIDQAKEQLHRNPYSLPKVILNTEFWPTVSGECGIGPIDAEAVISGFNNEHFCKCLLNEDIQLVDYKYHPTIKAPLSN